MNPNDKRKRSSQRNDKQNKYLINYMHNHREVAIGWLTGVRGKAKDYQFWKELTTELNLLGCEKTQIQWQKVWIDMKNNVKAKAVRLENACLKTGNFVIGANALSKDDLMILELIESAATKRCRDPDSMPGEMSAIKEPHTADESILNEIPTHTSVSEELKIVGITSMRDSAMATRESHQLELFSHPGTSVDVVCGNDGTNMTSSLHTQSHPSSQQTTSIIETASRPVSTPCAKKTSRKDNVFKKFLKMGEKQNKILERISQAVLTIANNESQRLELEKEKLQLKRQTCHILNAFISDDEI